jgi:hypothetical protein
MQALTAQLTAMYTMGVTLACSACAVISPYAQLLPSARFLLTLLAAHLLSCRLAAYICGYTTVTIVISGNYSLNNFREDLQKMYKRAGLKGEGLLFLFTDSQVVDERMLVYVNDLLASGEIPDLFAQVCRSCRRCT